MQRTMTVVSVEGEVVEAEDLKDPVYSVSFRVESGAFYSVGDKVMVTTDRDD